MQTVTSKDGTTIAYDKIGQGPAVIIVNGATARRGSMGELVKQLASHFTVYDYDRRGRGDSTDTLPFAVEREIEDIAALINAAGGSAFVYGISSGGALALQAAVKLSQIKKLAMYEAPYNDDPPAQHRWREYVTNLNGALAENRRGDAVAEFLKIVGLPDEAIAGMRHAPMFPGLESIAPTLAYDQNALGATAAVPTEPAARVNVPALVMAGGAGAPFMSVSAKKLAQAMPHAQYRLLEGQTHDVSGAVLAPVLTEFFLA